ncbi:2-hydroxychromene-2-carboxylate isomerase [Solimonas sp. K1W22B-7]|uniref:2-hydroxychromene-2-carboxylate isomerase n=1 Tax=Solimonas sp. K1W22B-7 TaxID=2303331 RepID=UPI001968F057|nr:2-hydroxychromene-2-carboxylate isomerase [Solimonas sp. K1W22B-7]
MKSVDFYYDFGSPTAYLAWTQLARICADKNAQLVYKPFLLGAVFKATGNQSPVMIPAKAKFMFADLKRWAQHWNVPLTLNPHFPFNTLDFMRAAAGVQLHMPERFEEFNRAIYEGMWVQAKDFSKPAVVAEALAAVGFDPAAVLALAADDAAKAALRANTDEALARGAFGAPTFVVDGELYWGQDRLFMVEAALAA